MSSYSSLEEMQQPSNKEIYSAIENVLTDLNDAVKANTGKIRDRYISSLLSPRDIKDSYKIVRVGYNYVTESDEKETLKETLNADLGVLYHKYTLFKEIEEKQMGEDRLAFMLKDNADFRDFVKKYGVRSRVTRSYFIKINKDLLSRDSLYNGELYRGIAHELTHIALRNHSNERVFGHGVQFFDYLTRFGAKAIPKASCYYEIDIMEKDSYNRHGEHRSKKREEVWFEDNISIIEDSYLQYRMSNGLSQRELEAKDVLGVLSADFAFSRFVVDNFMHVNLDMLDIDEKRFLTKALYMNGNKSRTIYFSNGTMVPPEQAVAILNGNV